MEGVLAGIVIVVMITIAIPGRIHGQAEIAGHLLIIDADMGIQVVLANPGVIIELHPDTVTTLIPGTDDPGRLAPGVDITHTMGVSPGYLNIVINSR